MATSYTSLLGLALPVTGELSGTWGDTVNNYITNYLDAAVAGVQIISGSQTAVTLSVTNGSSLVQVGAGATGSAQYGIIRCSGNPASLLTITAPAASKSYLIINATSTSQSVKIVGTGPTTGVTLVSGESAVVAWNGTDFIKVSSSAVDGVSTFSAGTTGFTPSTATSGAVTLAGTLATTNGGTGLTSFTANRVFYSSSTSAIGQSANLTFDGTTLTANALTTTSTVTINGGTANGVAYLNGSKVLTTGSALTFDGTALTVGSNGLYLSGNTAGAAYVSTYAASAITEMIFGTSSNVPIRFIQNNSEQMRLTSTGLGIGTSSPQARLHINSGAGSTQFRMGPNSTSSDRALINYNSTTNRFTIDMSGNDAVVVDGSGNLGLGVTPSAWTTGWKAFQIASTSSLTDFSNQSSYWNNCVVTGATNPIYQTTAAASFYRQTTGQHLWYNAPSGTAGNAITFTQAMTLTAGGSLLIGTTTDPGDNLYTPGSIRAATVKVDGGAYITGPGSDVLAMYAGSNERARITSGGEFLVGTANAAGTSGVGVALNPTANGVRAVSAASTNASETFSMYSTGASAYRFYVDWSGKVNATNTTIAAISDQRLKENVRDLDDGIGAIMALKPRKFDWKAGKGKDIKDDRGFIAQEFEQVFPDMIDNWKDPAPEGEEPYKSVRADLIPVLVKAIQELKAEFDAYKATHP